MSKFLGERLWITILLFFFTCRRARTNSFCWVRCEMPSWGENLTHNTLNQNTWNTWPAQNARIACILVRGYWLWGSASADELLSVLNTLWSQTVHSMRGETSLYTLEQLFMDHRPWSASSSIHKLSTLGQICVAQKQSKHNCQIL